MIDIPGQVQGFRVLVCRDSMGEAFIGYAMSDKGNQTSSSVGSGTIKAADVVAWEVGIGVVLDQLSLLYANHIYLVLRGIVVKLRGSGVEAIGIPLRRRSDYLYQTWHTL